MSQSDNDSQSDRNGWYRSERFVIEKLKDLEESNKEICKQLDKNTIDISNLSVKAGIWGSVASALIFIILKLLKLN